ncbi:hypothetical protein GA0074692_4439 [Micromonospora pallida]|uniref:DUF11 domain-containing protein n=1 Tax=Micromonospora pallida TaxID=145854 RepID=A0A1C6T4V2_9ACTN|nr:hypothetical protein [Micromonospora pallida]SCL36771.1 hypothetical protein GA0074692_4439 [Micromonospora pallida]
MTPIDPPRPGGRFRDRWVVPLLSVSLAIAVAALLPGLAAAAVSPGLAAAAPMAAGQAYGPVTEPAENGDPEASTDPPDPTEPAPSTPPPTGEPPGETPPPTTGAPDPLPTATTAGPLPTVTRTSTPRPPLPTHAPPSTSAPGQPAPARLGVRVTTGDVRLTARYWNAAHTTATLRVTVTNTGGVTGRLSLAYTLPTGVTDAGTPGCAPAGDRGYRCGAWTVAPGARFSSLVRVRVSGDAWRRIPLGGTVTVTGTAPGQTAPVRDDEGFAVLFPPGPPVPGIDLAADEVAFDVGGGPSTLEVRLGNTGRADAAGMVEVVLPDGVSVSDPPDGCTTLPTGRTRCAAGTVPAGRTAVLRLPVAATPGAQRLAPLSGGVVGQLDPRNGPNRRVQMSFRITAAASVAGVDQSTGSADVLTGSTRSSGPDGGWSSAQRTAIILIGASGFLVVLALTLATTSLRRRLAGPSAGSASTGGETK